jgi:hypothetical protein
MHSTWIQNHFPIFQVGEALDSPEWMIPREQLMVFDVSGAFANVVANGRPIKRFELKALGVRDLQFVLVNSNAIILKPD